MSLISAKAGFSCNKRTRNKDLNVDYFHMKPFENERLCSQTRSLSSHKTTFPSLSYLAAAIKGASE